MNSIEAGYYLLFSNYVKNAFGKLARPYGFHYKNRGLDNWKFSRVNEYGMEEVVVIEIRFGVNAEVRMDAFLDTPGEHYFFMDGYEFGDIADFKEVISKFGETLKTKGDRFFEWRREQPVNRFSTPALHTALYRNYPLLKEQCKKRTEFENEMTLEDICAAVDNELEKIRNCPFDQSIEENFLQLAALVGDAYAKEYGWSWTEADGCACLVDNNRDLRLNPLITILTGWQCRDHYVTAQYRNIRDDIRQKQG